ncbi:uncharacterized protein BDW47DRAFT_109802 [Aspergillus candidus]|uniref:Uncharacterized protein n=1 Tax=Aspergillus candidus TaxID=41067 RepID=A0A2I2F598_ASPCN|nr:hypothetical protein BDW47DRAFT_109802 [Aspergillus candidus]PLB35783.1 hypothetical protein BDW47DRAFT_109802 [Aspergillus candidus]
MVKRQELDGTPDTEEEAADLAEAAAKADDHDIHGDINVGPQYDYDHNFDVDVDVDINGTDNDEKYEDQLEGGIREQLEAAASAGTY